MKRFLFIAILIAIQAVTAVAQYYPVDTVWLNRAYRNLTRKPRTAAAEQEFLEAFPTTWMEFYMTYLYVDDDTYDTRMAEQCRDHVDALFGLSHLNDTVVCKKIVDLVVGMKQNCEQTDRLQEYVVSYLFGNDKLVLNYLSRLKKGYQMEFWQFCWSTVTECSWEECFKTLYNRNKKSYPQLMEVSRIAFEYFYDGVNYPDMFPHKKEEYHKKYIDKGYKAQFSGYEK